MVAAEALTLRLPCVVSKVGGLKDIVNDKCGKLCVLNNEYIVEINKLLSDANYYEKKRKNAVVQSNHLNNITQYINKLNKIYES